MRPLTIAGILLVLAGGYVLVRGFSYTASKSTLKVGEFEASVEEKKDVPTWVGVIALAGGAALIVAGLQKKSGGGA